MITIVIQYSQPPPKELLLIIFLMLEGERLRGLEPHPSPSQQTELTFQPQTKSRALSVTSQLPLFLHSFLIIISELQSFPTFNPAWSRHHEDCHQSLQSTHCAFQCLDAKQGSREGVPAGPHLVGITVLIAQRR